MRIVIRTIMPFSFLWCQPRRRHPHHSPPLTMWYFFFEKCASSHQLQRKMNCRCGLHRHSRWPSCHSACHVACAAHATGPELVQRLDDHISKYLCTNMFTHVTGLYTCLTYVGSEVVQLLNDRSVALMELPSAQLDRDAYHTHLCPASACTHAA